MIETSHGDDLLKTHGKLCDEYYTVSKLELGEQLKLRTAPQKNHKKKYKNSAGDSFKKKNLNKLCPDEYASHSHTAWHLKKKKLLANHVH